MLHPLLLLIVIVNSWLQAEELNLLTSTNTIQSLKKKLSQWRPDTTLFNDIDCETVELCKKKPLAKTRNVAASPKSKKKN